MTKSIAYMNAVHYRSIILRAFAETTQYEKWGDDFARKECFEARDHVPVDSIDITELTKEEALELGFRLYDKDKTLYLIPMWMLPACNKSVKVESISGDIKPISDIDNDNRAGLLAFGIHFE